MDLLNRIKARLTPAPMLRDNGFDFWLETVERDKREEIEGTTTHSLGSNSEWTWRPGFGWVRD